MREIERVTNLSMLKEMICFTFNFVQLSTEYMKKNIQQQAAKCHPSFSFLCNIFKKSRIPFLFTATIDAIKLIASV